MLIFVYIKSNANCHFLLFFIVKTLNNFWFNCGMANKMIPRFFVAFSIYLYVHFPFLFCLSFICSFIPCHCTWTVVFSFRTDYQWNVHSMFIILVINNRSETDRRRKNIKIIPTTEWEGERKQTSQITKKTTIW